MRFQTVSEDKTLYIDYTLPRPSTKSPGENEASAYWLYLEHVDDFLQTGVREDITVTFPFETSDSTVILQSENLTYRFHPLISQQPYRLFDNLSSDPISEFSIQHSAFAQSVYVANLVGEKMELQIAPETRHVEFSATGRGDGDAFRYPLSTEQINTVDGASSKFTISIDRLRDITPYIPDTSVVSFRLTPDYLVYDVEHPLPGAQLTMYIAERLSSL